MEFTTVTSSVAGVDPDSRIHVSDRPMDPASDPDPLIFDFLTLTFKGQTKPIFFKGFFSAYYFLKVHLHHFLQIKSQTK
jgi:hypothetical protein